MAEENNTYSSTKKVGYSIIFAVVSVAIACGSFISAPSYFLSISARATLFVTYLALGVVYAFIFCIKEKVSFSFTAILGLAILLSLLTFHFYLLYDQIFNALSYTASFLLPAVIFYNYVAYSTNSSKTVQKVWYPDQNLISNKAIIFLNNIPIQFKLVVSSAGKKYEIFKTVAPSQMSLGKIFQAFLMQQANNNFHIDQKDERGKKVGWLFYAQVARGINLRPLDPELSLRENSIKSKTVIILQRVKSEILQLEYTSAE